MLKHHSIAPEKPKRVVVLGSMGFVGKDLMRKLEEQGIEAVGVSSKEIDLTQPSAVDLLARRVAPDDSLVFVSAITPDRGRDARTFLRNLSMAEHVAAFLEKNALRHFVYISSDALYDDGAHPVRESSPLGGGGFHGQMHAGRELILKTALAKTKAPAAWLRPCAIYGAADTHNSYGPNRFLRTALKERKITLFGEGEEKRDHVFIDDLSRLTASVLLHRSEGTLNVATGASVSFHEVARAVIGLVGRDVQLVCQPRANPVTHRHFDTTAVLKSFPGFRFRSLEEGLAVTHREATRNV